MAGKKQLLILAFFGTTLWGCRPVLPVDRAKDLNYPKEWGRVIIGNKESCLNFSGTYALEGDAIPSYFSGKDCRDAVANWLFLEDKAVDPEKAKSITIRQDSCDSLDITISGKGMKSSRRVTVADGDVLFMTSGVFIGGTHMPFLTKAITMPLDLFSNTRLKGFLAKTPGGALIVSPPKGPDMCRIRST